MSQMIHTIEVPEGALTGLSQKGRLLIGSLPNQTNAAGGSAGASVAVNITGLKNLPANYTVMVQMNQSGDAAVTSKTSTGFTVTLYPPSATATLAAGTFDCLIVG